MSNYCESTVDYGKAIRVARASRGMDQRELASKAELNASYISMIEAGKRNASTEALLAISKALRVPMWALVVIGSTDVPDGVRGATMSLLAAKDVVP